MSKKEIDNVDPIEENLTGQLQPEGDEILPEHIDKESATGLCERIGARRDKISDLEALADIRISALQEKIELTEAWLEQEKKELEASILFFSAPLEHWIRAENAGNSKIKSIKLPTGTLKLRTGRGNVEIENTIDDIPASFHTIKTTTTLDKRAVLVQIKETGDIPLGITYTPGEVTFTIETTEVSNG